MIQYTEAMEEISEKENTAQKKNRYIDCFKGVDLRRTEIACWAWLIQITSGGPLQGYSTYFFSQAGLSTVNAFNMSMAIYIALGAVGTILSWFLVNRVGRRRCTCGARLPCSRPCSSPACSDSSSRVLPCRGRWEPCCCCAPSSTTSRWDDLLCHHRRGLVDATAQQDDRAGVQRLQRGLIIANILQPNMLNSDEWNWEPRPASSGQAPVPSRSSGPTLGFPSSQTGAFSTQPSNLLKAAETQTGSRCLTLRAHVADSFLFRSIFFFVQPGPTASWMCCSALRCPLASLRRRASTSSRRSSTRWHRPTSRRSSVSGQGRRRGGRWHHRRTAPQVAVIGPIKQRAWLTICGRLPSEAKLSQRNAALVMSFQDDGRFASTLDSCSRVTVVLWS